MRPRFDLGWPHSCANRGATIGLNMSGPATFNVFGVPHGYVSPMWIAVAGVAFFPRSHSGSIVFSLVQTSVLFSTPLKTPNSRATADFYPELGTLVSMAQLDAAPSNRAELLMRQANRAASNRAYRTVSLSSFEEYLASEDDSPEEQAEQARDRKERLSRFPYTVMLQVSFLEMDFANRWCWQHFLVLAMANARSVIQNTACAISRNTMRTPASGCAIGS